MIRNYLTIAWRSLIKSKATFLINIGGLAAGMAVAMLIGLWIWDELSFDKYNKNCDRIVQVMAQANIGNGKTAQAALPLPVSTELRDKYGSNFKQVASTITFEQSIGFGDNVFTKVGCYSEPAITDIFTLNMVKGSAASFNQPGAILLNESLAKTIFGNADPINKVVKLNNSYLLKVTGVYADMPKNTQLYDVNFIAPVKQLFEGGGDMNNWYSSAFNIYALLNPSANMEGVSSKINNILYEHSKDATKPALFLFPMRLWHLYQFKNGVLVGGQLQFVWLFGLIAIFVLLLACINFMNLSTARSEKRAKEVGIRKAIGSLRGQLIAQFFIESYLVVITAFVIAVLLVLAALPFFNNLAGKQMAIVWNNPVIWVLCLVFCFITGLVSGSYPAFYLSSFNPVKILKGTFKVGRLASMPRKVLVVVQFAISVTLIISTLIVFKQIQFAKNRPIGYTRDGLLSIPYNTAEIHNYSAFRNELLRTNAVTGVSASSSPTTGVWSSADNLDWRGKDPNRQESFGTILVDPDFGDLIGWKIKEGRNFSKQFLTDSSGFMFNEAAIKQMGLTNPIGETIKWHGRNWNVIGVVKDMVMTSPFDPITPVVFLMDTKERSFNVINLKINPGMPAAEALSKIESVYKRFAPGSPFNYKFADSEYAMKFMAEERISKLASVFAVLAIFISCLGLFGMASFVAEQRVKEIGVRKVLGASVLNLWGMLSKDFITLVIIALFIASPVAWYFMHGWLQSYQYRTEISWWIFASAGAGAVILTLVTVSYQSIKAALANPVRSLRSE